LDWNRRDGLPLLLRLLRREKLRWRKKFGQRGYYLSFRKKTLRG
jgi:hypothetical protein